MGLRDYRSANELAARVAELERRNAALEERTAALEQIVGGQAKDKDDGRIDHGTRVA